MLSIVIGLVSDVNFLSAFFTTLIVIALGWLFFRKKWLSSAGKGTINAILMKLAIPCLAFDAFMADFDAQGFVSNLQVLLLSVVMYAAFITVSQLIFHRFGKSRANIYGIFFAVGQVTLFSMPILKSIYAADSGQAMLACNMLTIAFRLVVYIYAFYSVSGTAVTRGNLAASLRQIALNPIMIAMFAGFFIWIAQGSLPQIATPFGSYAFLRLDKTVPALYAVVHVFEKMVNPLAMLLVGMTLGEADMREAFRDKTAWLISLLRMLVAPAAVLLLLFVTQSAGWTHFGEQTAMSLVIGFGAPVSVMVSSFCIMYQQEGEMASRVCLISTLLCVISIPMLYIFTKYAFTLPCFA